MKKCNHKWVKIIEFKRFFTKSTYSKCEKCGLLKHDNDGNILNPEILSDEKCGKEIL